MAKPIRRRTTMLVTVSYPGEYTAADARKEVRENIKGQRMNFMDEGDVKVLGVKPAPRTR